MQSSRVTSENEEENGRMAHKKTLISGHTSLEDSSASSNSLVEAFLLLSEFKAANAASCHVDSKTPPQKRDCGCNRLFVLLERKQAEAIVCFRVVSPGLMLGQGYFEALSENKFCPPSKWVNIRFDACSPTLAQFTHTHFRTLTKTDVYP